MKTVLSKFLRRIRNDDGFTLAEVMVAFSVLAIIGTAATFALVNSTGIISNNETKDAATQYVRDYMESAKAVEYSLLGFSTGDSTAASTVIRGGSNYPQVRASGMTTSANGLAPRVTESIDGKTYNIYTYIYWTDGSAPSNPLTAYEQKTVEVEVWESGALVAAGQFVRTPTVAESAATGGAVNADLINEGQMKPEEPSIVTSLFGDDDRRVRVEFSAAYATSYTLQYRIGNGAWVSVTDSSFSDTLIDPKVYNSIVFPQGSEVTFKVVGVNSAGNGAPGTTTVSIPAGIPPAPTVFTQQNNNNTVKIYWAPVQYADTYSVNYTINGVDQGSYTVSDPTQFMTSAHNPGDNLVVTVTGYNGGTAGAPGTASLTLANMTPAAPVISYEINKDAMNVSWPPVDNATQYQVFWTINGVAQPVETTSAKTVVLDGYSRGDNITVKVRAGNSAGSFGPYSNIITYVANWTVPAAPVPTRTITQSGTDFIFNATWPSVPNAAYYEIYYIAGSGKYSSDISQWKMDSISTTSWDFKLTVGTPIYVKIKAYSAEGFASEFSTTLTGYKSDQTPAQITTTNVYQFKQSIESTNTSSEAIYSWNSVPYAVQYELRIKDDNGVWTEQLYTTSLSYKINLPRNSYNEVQVRGVSITGLTGVWSDSLIYSRGPSTPPSLSTNNTTGASRINAVWGSVIGAEEYELEYYVNYGTGGQEGPYTWSTVQTGAGNIDFNMNVDQGDRITVHARAKSDLGNGPWSSWVISDYATFDADVTANQPTYAEGDSGGTWSYNGGANCSEDNLVKQMRYQMDYGNNDTNTSYANNDTGWSQNFGYDLYPTGYVADRCANTVTGQVGGSGGWSAGYKGHRGANVGNPNTWNNNSKLRFAQIVKRVYPYSGYDSTDWNNFQFRNPGYGLYSEYSKAMQQAMNRHGDGATSSTDGFWGPDSTRKIVDAHKDWCYLSGVSESSQTFSSGVWNPLQTCWNMKVETDQM